MDSDGDEVFGCFGLLIFMGMMVYVAFEIMVESFVTVILPIVAMIVVMITMTALVIWLINNWDDVVEILVMMVEMVAEIVVAILWVSHYLPAWLLLVFMRNLVVEKWSLVTSGVWERRLVVFWLGGVSSLLGVGWFSGTVMVIDGVLPIFFAIVLALCSAVGVLASYFDVYFERQPKCLAWPKFLRAEKELGFDLWLWWIEQRTRLRLWWTNL